MPHTVPEQVKVQVAHILRMKVQIACHIAKTTKNGKNVKANYMVQSNSWFLSNGKIWSMVLLVQRLAMWRLSWCPKKSLGSSWNKKVLTLGTLSGEMLSAQAPLRFPQRSVWHHCAFPLHVQQAFQVARFHQAKGTSTSISSQERLQLMEYQRLRWTF